VKKERTPKILKPTQSHPKAPADPLAVRTVLISGLPSSIDSKAIWKKVKKLEGAEKIEYPVEGENSDVGEPHIYIGNYYSHYPCSSCFIYNTIHGPGRSVKTSCTRFQGVSIVGNFEKTLGSPCETLHYKQKS
jgi:hypothetical protein